MSQSHRVRVVAFLPGLAVAAATGMASVFVADHLGTTILGYEHSPISSVMVALLVGMIAGNLLRIPKFFDHGLALAAKRVLRVGIVLLGIRLSIGQVALLGAVGVPIVLGCVGAALTITLLVSKALRLPGRLGTLIAVGTSICGVSAIVATAPAIGADDEEVAYAVSVITIFGLFATIFYPLYAHFAFNGDPIASGMFLGTSIHDTSQVTGAGLVYSELYSAPDALNAATVTKLVRNLFMSAVIPLIAFARHRDEQRKLEVTGSPVSRFVGLVPTFLIGFVCLALVRTAGDATMVSTGNAFWLLGEDTWIGIISTTKTIAVYCLVTALAGVGMRIRFRSLARLGVKPLIAGLAAALSVGAVSTVLVVLLGSLVRLT